jgi:hypothetical protein
MKTLRITFLLALVVALLAAVIVWWLDQSTPAGQPTPSPSPSVSTAASATPAPTTQSSAYRSAKGVAVIVEEPVQNAKVGSPLIVRGQVPGNWSFEASFPVVIKSAQGDILAQGPAELQGEWMTEALVPFTATLKFTAPAGTTGILELQKNNPSGMTESDDVVKVPVRF